MQAEQEHRRGQDLRRDALEHRRLSESLRWLGSALATLVACAEPVAPAIAESAEASPPTIAIVDGDALLAAARRSIEHGALAPEPKAALLASTAPAHARARALLEAMDAAAAPLRAPVVDSEVIAPAVPVEPIVAPPLPATPAPAPAPARPTLERLAMRSTKAGAALTLHANSGVLVGVANQPEAGVVRLVLEDVAAAAKVLASRPRVTGARVRDVSVGPKSVRITLQLEPGWRFGGVVRTKTGARVDLVGP